MAEYIAKKLAIELMHQSSYLSDGDLLEVNGKLAKARIEAEPAADVVPVVRCDDCVYYGSRRWCELHSSVFDDNAFCSYGERKE